LSLQSLQDPDEDGDEPVDVASVVDAGGLQHHQSAEQTRRRSLKCWKVHLRKCVCKCQS